MCAVVPRRLLILTPESPNMAVSEKSLIAGCRRGSTKAWERLLDRHYDTVARYIFQVDPSLSRREVEDLCEEVFIASVGRIEEAKDAPSVRTWFLRDASHRARAVQDRATTASAGRDEARAPVVSPDAKVRMVLDRLGGPCREMLELHYFGQLSSEELAGAFEMQPGTVQTRLVKCLKRLEDFAQEADPEPV